MTRYHFSPSQLARMESFRWLTDREREAFELYYRRGWNIEDVAAEMECCRGTVNNLLHSIREKTI